jgi:biotin transport system substrate-specific component
MINSSYLMVPTLGDRSYFRDALVVMGASVLIALFALISIPLPFTPVPLVAQAQVVLFLGVLLGKKRAAAAVSLFLIQGAWGLPVFAGGVGGISKLVGPTGGYLIGYLAAAFITGWIWELCKDKTPLRAFFAMAAGNLVIFACGSVWLSQFVGWTGAWMLGVVPFLMGDLFKLLVATRLFKASSRLV